MTDQITVEGPDLGAALSKAAEELSASSVDELAWEYDKEHFRKGADTVRLFAKLQDEETLQALKEASRGADEASEWMSRALELFGAEAKVSARIRGSEVAVSVLSPDASLLIGREGKNIQAFQLLLASAMAKANGTQSVRLDVDSPDRDRSRGRDRDDRGRGRDDRGRGRGRDENRREGRGGRDGGRRRDRPPRDEARDAARDAEIQKMARAAADRVLDGEDSVVMDGMNPYERHLAHTAIREMEGVISQSVGSGRDRRVEVIAE